MAAEEDETSREKKRIDELEQETIDANDLAYLFGHRPEPPVRQDVERDIQLIKVKGKSGKERRLFPVYSKTGQPVGFRAIDVDNTFKEIFDEDMTLANLDPEELIVVREHVNLIALTQSLNDTSGVDLSEVQEFVANQLKNFLITSRSKKGFAAWLVKTEKSISEGALERIQRQVEEKKQKRWGLF